jgi:hypothetical protein
MSRIRIVGGTITKKTGGNHSIYTDGNIVQNAGKAIKETSDKGVTHDKPKNTPPPPLLKKYFVDGWWALDKEGNKKIKRAVPGMTVYFHLKTKNIANGQSVFMYLFDEDNHEKEEPQNKNGKKDKDDAIKLVNTKSKKEVLVAKVNDGKVVQIINLSNLGSFINDEQDRCLELYFRCSYNIENVQFPRNVKEYLKVGAIVIDRYKMPGLNSDGSDIADDMTYGKGIKHGGKIYAEDILKKFKKEYEENGFDSQKHALFSHKKNDDAANSKAKYSKEECYHTSYKIQIPIIKKLIPEISTGLDVRLFDNFSTENLFWDFEQTATLYFASGELQGNIKRMIAKFKRNEGGVYEDKVLTKYVSDNPNTKIYCNYVEEYIAEKLKENHIDLEKTEDKRIYFNNDNQKRRDNGKVTDKKDKGGNIIPFSKPTYSYDNLSNVTGGLTIALNDIWAAEVMLTELRFDNDNYKGKYQVTLWDHFGLDLPDMEKVFNLIPSVGETFVTWFILQHLRGYKPFITKMTFEREFSGNIKEGKIARENKRKAEENKKTKEWIEKEKIKMLREPKF